jgi:GDPmannose 4,6-dehydratase
MKKALIFGITGQDGSYLAELLLEKEYEVHGVIRRASTFNTERIDHLYQDPHVRGVKLKLHYGDLADANTVRKLVYAVKPDEIYNLAAQSHVRVSFDIPEYTGNITALGALRILEAVNDYQNETGKTVKFYQASSSEMFGSAPAPQSEGTPFHPRSPYAIAKTFAHYTTINYREAYGIFAVSGILFNHESPRRGETFVTRKIARGVARIKTGLDKKLYLGNLDARRDWGYAPEYVEAMWKMLQRDEPEDFVIGTGESHTVKEFLNEAFTCAGLGSYEKYVEIDPRYYRPAEVDDLRADAQNAKKKLGWKAKTTFSELVRVMIDAELKRFEL